MASFNLKLHGSSHFFDQQLNARSLPKSANDFWRFGMGNFGDC
jgi:hypothetical protein